LAAEYKNYRDRVQRELGETQTRGRADVVNELIPTLDDLDRAAEHGDLEGPVKALAENLSAALGRLGVERYGTVGEPFDPVVHEAMTHAAGEGLDGPTVTAVYQPGYRLGERVIRAARVAVTE
jgi:molecular chaperone GrpE